MQEALGDEKLQTVLRAQLDPVPLPEGRRPAPRIDRHVEEPSAPATHELGLRMGRRLKMKPAKRARLGRDRMVVLHEYDIETGFSHPFRVPGFTKETTRISEPLRLED